MSNTDRDSMLERWADCMEKLEQYYEDKYGPPGTPATLPSVTDKNGMLAAIADGLERARININKDSSMYHDTNAAYVKTVPTGYVKNASIEKIGGKTIVWNQYANPTVVYQGNTAYPLTQGTSVITGHKYLIKATFSESASGALHLFTRQSGSNASVVNITASTSSKVFTSSYSATSDGTDDYNNGNLWIYTTFSGSDNATNLQLVDLTLMFGAGNEPSAAEFEEMFPASYYAYNAGTLLSAGVTEVVSKDGNNVTLQTISIPTAIRNLDGYGWSAGSVYNYIDYERKVFVKNVARVDLGSLTWNKQSSYFSTFSLEGSIKYPPSNTVAVNCVCEKYPTYDNTIVRSFSIQATSVSVAIFDSVAHSSYDGVQFASYLSGVYMYYELATPVETDISAYLTDDNIINVESGGTLTFENQHGDDYRIPVPSTETFWVDIS